MFERIQKRFGHQSGVYQKDEPHPLDGLVYCGRCGAKMYRIPRKTNGKAYPFYICSARHRFGTCKQERPSATAVEARVNELLEMSLSSGGDFRPKADRLSRDLGIAPRYAETLKGDLLRFFGVSSDLQARLRKEIEKKQRRQNEVYDDKLSGQVPAPVAERKLLSLQADIDAATQELASIKTEYTNEDFEAFNAWLDGKLMGCGKQVEREIHRMLVARVTVTGMNKNGTLLTEVEWTSYAETLLGAADKDIVTNDLGGLPQPDSEAVVRPAWPAGSRPHDGLRKARCNRPRQPVQQQVRSCNRREPRRVS